MSALIFTKPHRRWGEFVHLLPTAADTARLVSRAILTISFEPKSSRTDDFKYLYFSLPSLVLGIIQIGNKR